MDGSSAEGPRFRMCCDVKAEHQLVSADKRAQGHTLDSGLSEYEAANSKSHGVSVASRPNSIKGKLWRTPIPVRPSILV